MALELVLSDKAYCKMVFHAAKHPHCTINGVLLAKRSPGKNKLLVDCIPFFHSTPLALMPMLEVALMQVDSYCKQKGLYIAGYYQGGDHIQNKIGPDVVANLTANRIHENAASQGPACLIIINNKHFGLDASLDGASHHRDFTLYENNDGKWLPQKHPLTMAAKQTGVTNFASHKLHWNIVDFDDTLDDASLDWRNSHLDKDLTEFLNVEV